MTLLPRTLMSMKWRSCGSKAANSSSNEREARRVAGLRAELLPGARVDAVVQGDLQHLGQVEVAGQVVVLLAERAHLHAAARAAAARVGHDLALPHQLLHDQVGVEDRGLAEAGADDLAGALDEAVGVLLADLDRGAGLQQAHLLDHVQQQVGDLVDAVRAVGSACRPMLIWAKSV